MTKRISISLPDNTHDKLQQWAEQEGRPLAQLASYIIQRAVDVAESEGKLKNTQSDKDEEKVDN